MVDNLLVQDLVLIVLLWLGVSQYKRWACNRAATGLATRRLARPLLKHSRDPTPFPGLTRKPHCAACEQGPAPAEPAPLPPPLLPTLQGRPRQVDTSTQFCPQPCCVYYGWMGRGNLRANGYPNGGRWRQFQCLSCKQYFLETQGTPLHGKRVEPERLMWAVEALAEGLGIRAVARVFAVDPNTVLQWVMEVADQAAAWYAKEPPTFSDAIAVVRRHLWSQCPFSMSAADNDVIKIPRALFDRLTEACA
jgi:transposase-like protein